MSRHSAINRFGRSSNPSFSRGFEGHTESLPLSERMTLDGAVNKTGILLALCFSGSAIGWNIPALMFPAEIVGFILAMVRYLEVKKKLAQLNLYMHYHKECFLAA